MRWPAPPGGSLNKFDAWQRALFLGQHGPAAGIQTLFFCHLERFGHWIARKPAENPVQENNNMCYRRALLVALFCLPGLAGAASFDCSKAGSSAERLICSDPQLSALDESLAAAYAAAFAGSADPDGFVSSQRKWLARRNACRDLPCIRKAYETRLRELAAMPTDVNCDPAKGLVDTDRCQGPAARRGSRDPDPFDDGNLTCDEMRKHPVRVFTEMPDLGSGGLAPIDVDYGCEESLGSLPFLQKLKALTEQVRREGGPRECTGSIIHAHWRYYHFKLLRAGMAPQMLPDLEARERNAAALYPQLIEANLLDYFERWSYESLYNFELYRAYMDELERAKDALGTHYERKHRLAPPRARRLAHLGTRLFVERAAGTFPRDYVAENQHIVKLAAAVKGPLDEVKSKVHGIDSGTALNIGLLLQRPPEHVAHLLKVLESVDSLNFGDESPLFFALRNGSNVRLLLERGADVNYQNPFGKTPLFYAISFNDQVMVALLLDKGAAVNHRYALPTKDEAAPNCLYQVQSGRTPLMHAAQHADVAMLKLLLDRGANLKDIDAGGANATVYALRGDRGENAAFLKSLDLTK